MGDTLQYAEWEVFLGDTDGNPPTSSDKVTFLKPIEIYRSAGGSQLDYAVFLYDLAEAEERIENLSTPLRFARLVEVRKPGDPWGEPIFWGELTSQAIELGAREMVLVTARIEPYHFGQTMLGMTVNDGGTPELDQSGIVFNPLIDGTIKGNRSSINHPDRGYKLWVSPESVRTTPAVDLQGTEGLFWLLGSLLESVSKSVNYDEEFILNIEDFTASMFNQGPGIFNVQLPRGRYLPEYLDAVLIPRGFDWYVSHFQTMGGESRRRIIVYRQNTGTVKTVKYLAVDSQLDFDNHNIASVRVETDIARLANVIIGHGGLKQYEVTIPLVKGWPEDKDFLGIDDLARSDEESEFEANQTVHRLWVANEAGDYTGSREEIEGHLDLSGVAEIAVPKRRRLMDCLTLDENGRRRPPYVEWRENDEAEWQPVPSEWGVSILQDQMGIYFSGDRPPGDLVDAGLDAEVRVTGTFAGDSRLAARIDITSTSPNARNVELFLDLSDRFQFRTRVTGGDYASRFDDLADVIDDEFALEGYLTKVQETSESAKLIAPIVLFGIYYDYEIGDRISKIEGREVSLDKNSSGAASPRYPEIVAIRWDYQNQTTELILE